MERRPSLRLILSIVVGVAVVIYLGMILYLSSRKPDSSTQEGAMQVFQATIEITLEPAREVEISFSSKMAPPDMDDVVLVFPSGTPDETYTIRISSRDLDTLSEVGVPGWQHLNVINVEIMNKENAPIEVPMEVCFVLTNESWNEFITTPGSFRVEFFDETLSPASWIPLTQNILDDRHMICGMATKLSLFALSTNNVNQITPPEAGTHEPYRP